jgi:hypothetical protein
MNITSVRIIPRLAQASAIAICLVFSTACVQEQAPQTAHEPVVDELITLLEARPALKSSLVAAIETADVEHIQDLDAFFDHVDGLVTWIPVEREILSRALVVKFIINQAPEDALNEDAEFSEWMSHMVRAWGEFLDTPASAAGIESFSSLPNYNIDDYFVGPSGWLTFNQFFAREVRPGKRPVSEPRDDTVIVSPADAVFMGAWPIDENSNITVKGVNWSIQELLDGSPFADEFRDGIYMHSFLYIDDYHRYHVPVGGVIKEIRNIHGRVYMDLPVQPGARSRRHRFSRAWPRRGIADRHVLRVVREPDTGGRRRATERRGVWLLPVRRFRYRYRIPGQERRTRCRGRQEVFAGAAHRLNGTA